MTRWFAFAVVAATVGWSAWAVLNRPAPPAQLEGPNAARLELTRVEPAGDRLEGDAGAPVQVRFELYNPGTQPVELAPLAIGCSCMVRQAPDSVVPPQGRTTAVLELRYPSSGQTAFPLTVQGRDGAVLATTEVRLASNRKLPYFLDLPKTLTLQQVEGVPRQGWPVGITCIEQADAAPHVREARIVEGASVFTATLTMTENPGSSDTETMRTYQVTLDRAAMPAETEQSVSGKQVYKGTLVLQLSDDTTTTVPWSLETMPPVAMRYDAATRQLRGVRRGGAAGDVRVVIQPPEGGTATPDRFVAGEAIVSDLVLDPSAADVVVELHYDAGADDPLVIPVSLAP